MATKKLHIKSEGGFVLVSALLILIVLTIIGIAAMINTSTEIQISGNDKFNKMTFYEADAGSIQGVELLEQSFSCSTGFKVGAGNWGDLSNTFVRVYQQGGDTVFTNNPKPSALDILDNTKADAAYPIANLISGVEAGYLYFGGETNLQSGGNIDQLAGYEGKGKAAAQSGVSKIYDIVSRFEGTANSQSIIYLGWRHVVSTPFPNLFGWCE